MSDFLFTVPSGEPVSLEPFHYAIIGQTQFSGKTTLIKRLADWVVSLGYKVLIFDTKETEADYAGFGHEVPVCLRETTDALVLLPLLETVFQRRLPTGYYSVLCDVTAGTKNFEQVIAKAKEKEKTTRSGWVQGACRTLYDLLERLQQQLEKVETLPTLELPYAINRMVLNDFPAASQQLFVKNAFEDLLHIYKRKTIGVIDEAFKFIPQGYSSAATKAIMTTITQGAKTGLFTWISTQFLAVTDKDPLKACAIKFLGTQDHITEVKHTLDLIPEARGKFSADDIMRLKVGHWILVRKRPPDVRVVYALPLGVLPKFGKQVAQGIRTPEYVRDHFLKPKMEVDEDLVWKEKYELEKRRREEAEVGSEQLKHDLDKNYKELEKTETELRDLRKQYDRWARQRKKIAAFGDFLLDLIVPNLEAEITEWLEKNAPALLGGGALQPGLEPGSTKIVHTETMPEIQHTIERPIVQTNEKTMVGRIITLASKGFFKEKQKISEISREITRVFAVSVNMKDVNKALTKAVQLKILEREKDSHRAWVYWLVPGAQERIKEAEA